MAKSLSEQIARDMALGTFPHKSAETIREEAEQPPVDTGERWTLTVRKRWGERIYFAFRLICGWPKQY